MKEKNINADPSISKMVLYLLNIKKISQKG